MTDSSSVQAPAPGGCCAAGEGFERALGLLSDAAFKVFAHLCLRAARAGGTLEFERSQLAQQVGKSRSALGRCLQELVRAGVCRIDPAPNQHRRSRLRLCAPFWPAAALAQTAAAEAGGAPPERGRQQLRGGVRSQRAGGLLAAPLRAGPLQRRRRAPGPGVAALRGVAGDGPARHSARLHAQVDGPARPAPSAADSQPVLLPSAAPGGARRDLSAVLLAAPARPLGALRATLGAS